MMWCERTIRRLASGVFLYLLCLPLWAEGVVSSPLDAREYRVLTLPNGLKVLLIHDSGAPELSWALSVKAGSATDPAAFPGLHRLAAIALQTQVNSEIDFSVSPRYTVFKLADYARQRSLQQVAQLLSSRPLTEVDIARAQQTLAERIRSVRSITPDERRLDVLMSVASAAVIGPSVSIAPMATLSPALSQYIESHYTPAQAALVVRSADSLDKLEAQVKKRLQIPAVASGVGAIAGFDALNFSRDTLPLEIQVNNRTEPARLLFYFPVANLKQFEANHSYAIAEYLLTRRGPGSLQALLHDLGWAKDIRFDLQHKPDGDGFVVIRLTLTPLGVRASPQVEALVFYVLQHIKQRAVDAWRFNELARAAHYHFQYRDAFSRRPLPELANRLQHTPPAQVLAAKYEFGAFNSPGIQRAMKFLRSDNVIVMLEDDGVDGDRVAGQSHAPYRLVEADARQPDIKPEVKRRLFLPDANKFIPQRLAVKSVQLLPGPQSASSSAPVKLIDKPRLTVWYQGGGQQPTPDATLFLRLITQGGNATADQAVDTLLSAYLLAEKLQAELDGAKRAGVEYVLRPTVFGVDIEVSGYNAQLGLILTRLGEVFDEPVVPERSVIRARRWLSSELSENGHLLRSFSDPFVLWQYEPYWSRSELRKAFESIDADHWRYRLNVKTLQMLVSGSLYQQEARRLAALAELKLLSDTDDRPAPARLTVAPDGRAHGLERRAEQLELYFRSGSNQARDYVFIRALAALLNGELINVADTEEALLTGDVASVAIRAQPRNIAGMAGLSLETSASVLTGPLLEALQRRLAMPDMAQRLAALKSQWRSEYFQEPRGRWAKRRLWRALTNPEPDITRAALAALNSASIERYAKKLFAAEIYFMAEGEGAPGAYRRDFRLQPLDFRLPVDFPPLRIE